MSKIGTEKKYPLVFMMMIFTLVIFISVAGPAIAEESKPLPVSDAPLPGSRQQGPADPAELGAFLDGLMKKDMAEYHIAGAAVSVVKDGELFFARGYGYADVENKIPVDPQKTGFRIGSVTKLFTWTALMQLIEEGKLDPDADINTYLDFRIPDTYPRPITIKNLFSHTEGFEERFFEMLVLDAGDSAPPREWFVRNMPARVRPPGDCAAYSNYGTSLAGYIVERVSGKPYARYIKDHILDPLGMARTSTQSLISSDLPADIVKGYTYENGAFKVFPDYYSQQAMVPASAIQSTAADMARFMIAHLKDDGSSDTQTTGVSILKKSTLQLMHSTLFTHNPRLLGTAYGFFDFSDNGQRTIGHSGEAQPFNSLLLLLPGRNLGLFVSYNSEGGGDLTNQHLGFQRAFFDHYYPVSEPGPLQSPADFSKRAGRFAGSYKLTRSAYTTLEKVKNLMGGVEIKNSGDGALIFVSPWFEKRYIEVKPLYFREEDGPYGIVFREDSQGHITHLFTDYTPMFAFEKLHWYETSGFNMVLLLCCILIFLSMLPVAITRVIRNRKLGANRKPESSSARVASWLITGICVLNLLFVLGTVLWGNPVPLFGISIIYMIVLGVGVLASVLTAGALVYTVLVWKYSYWSIASRVYYTLVTVAAVAFVWFLNYWNLLGWRY